MKSEVTANANCVNSFIVSILLNANTHVTFKPEDALIGTECSSGGKAVGSLSGCGGTGGSTELRLLFWHKPSDHEITFVIMGVV